MPPVSTVMTVEHSVLIAVAFLMAKHAAADFFLQSPRQRLEKGFYGKPGGLTHALTHAVLTAPVFALLPAVPATVVIALLAAEFAAHYHIDWVKEQVVRRRQWTSHDTSFWWALGLDQMLHGLTYVALLWVAYTP